VSKSVKVRHPVKCDYCKDGTAAVYDARTRPGTWAFMCEEHFITHGIGLGTGLGQRLIVKKT
jgi:hypothetical protein